LVLSHGTLAYGTLTTCGIACSRRATSTWDAARGSLLRILEYTAEAAGASVIAAPSHITAQACRCCGASPRVPRTPAARVHGCSRCGCVADR